MTVIIAERLSHRSLFFQLRITLFVAALMLVGLPLIQAQQVDLPSGSDADYQRLLQLRAQAQKTQRDAQIAALRRTATQSTDQNNRDRVLEQARADKEFKRRAALAVQQQQAADAYRKIKQSEINSWNGKGGSKISAGVPANFTASLPPLEAESGNKKGLFSGMISAPGKAVKGLGSLRPGFLGGKKKKQQQQATNPIAQFPPPESLTLDGVAPRMPAPPVVETNSPAIEVEEPKKKGFRIPLVSSLTGGKKKDENPYLDESDSDETPQKWQDAYPEENDAPPVKKGFFKSMTSSLPLIGNKNKEDPDAFYGPLGSSNPDVAEEVTAEMIDEPKSGFLSKLSLKKNKEAAPQNNGSSGTSSSKTRKDIYIVDSGQAQFFPFGKSGKQAAAQGLGEGTLVRMTKSGDDWCSIELSSGTMGVIRNKNLRRAKSQEIPANMFAHKSKATYPTTARINKPRSATGKGSAHRYTEPVNVPLPDLPVSDSDSAPLIGNGLLPPLEQESAIQ